MGSPAANVGFSVANPHALATILQASETRSIIAARDIFDISGTKLWARDQPVSQALQRKLIDRQLRHPLETCLYAEDGVTGRALVNAVEQLLARDTPLSALLRRHDDKIVHSAMHIPLHPVAQLLLTAGQASRPESFEHAVQAMALNGALMIARGGDTRELRQAMLCGLLHDLGEMYIDPLHGELDADRVLDVQSYRHLVVHPHVGRLLIEQLTNYPAEVARAVAEHHERLDGSGYPHCLQRDQVSPLGRLLAVTDSVLSVLRGEQPHLTRASVALRAVPGEFDLKWVGLVSYTARTQPPLQAEQSLADIQQRLTRLDLHLQAVQNKAGSLMLAAETPALKDAFGLAQHLLTRLRTGFNASGLWSREAVAAQDAAEVEAVEAELLFRLHAIQRAARLRAGDELPAGDDERLNLLCEGLVEI
ncbi:HD-GYP domain-containing protein [Ideonella sp. BN130291]|uniref:HD-GYP domain-containing protein n=1 Tax=Ideonella sp. BN130291 TaxID=3112940 RepID=UPI002E271C1F|nr:HD domain-containing phosphohydrolase [Ideonella sp. BN130291]